MAAKREVVIIGTGVLLGRDLTQRAVEALGNATKIMTMVQEPPESWLPKSLHGVEVENLCGFYFNRETRFDNYVRVAERVAEAAGAGESVVFVTYGSPPVYDRVVSLIVGLCDQQHMPCRVLPGVSSIDATLCFLGEPIGAGLQICEARWLVNNDIEFDVRLPLFLFQIGIFWTDGIPSPSEMHPSRLLDLKLYLLRKYPERHYAVFVRAPCYDGDAGYMRATELRALDIGEHIDLAGSSLFIPPVSLQSDSPKFWHSNS